MADHAGGQHSAVNLGIKLWRLLVEVLVHVFCKTKKYYIDQKAGNSMKQKLL